MTEFEKEKKLKLTINFKNEYKKIHKNFHR